MVPDSQIQIDLQLHVLGRRIAMIADDEPDGRISVDGDDILGFFDLYPHIRQTNSTAPGNFRQGRPVKLLENRLRFGGWAAPSPKNSWRHLRLW